MATGNWQLATGNDMNGHNKQMSDHDLLIRIDERVDKLDRCMSSHFRHHWAILLAAGTAMIGAITSLLIAIARS